MLRSVTEHSADPLLEFFIELLLGLLVGSKGLSTGRGGVHSLKIGHPEGISEMAPKCGLNCLL